MDETASLKSASPAVSTASAGTKRKRTADPKFYAVRVGHHPGIYHTWAECLEQVKGFPKSTFKSFASLTDAERFMKGENPTRGRSSSSAVTPKFYAVRNGKTPGIYADWPSAQEQITGWKAPKHRCFSTRLEAQRFLDEGKEVELWYDAEDVKNDSVVYHAPEGLETDERSTAPKKSKRTANGTTKPSKPATPKYNESDYEPGTGPFPLGTEDGFDPNIILDPETGEIVYKSQEQREATKIRASVNGYDGMIRIHTDGSSLRNGQEGAFAGIGVYFGPDDDRNISETLPGTRQTNQRAELTAIQRALETVPRNRDVAIITDSRYAIDCVTTWYINWRKNGWKTSAGKAVENKDLVENILSKIEERNRMKVQTLFEWVKGHANNPGNVAADKLAVGGARQGVNLES